MVDIVDAYIQAFIPIILPLIRYVHFIRLYSYYSI